MDGNYLKKNFRKFSTLFRNLYDTFTQNITNIVKFYVTFVIFKFYKFPNISNSVLLHKYFYFNDSLFSLDGELYFVKIEVIRS